MRRKRKWYEASGMRTYRVRIGTGGDAIRVVARDQQSAAIAGLRSILRVAEETPLIIEEVEPRPDGFGAPRIVDWWAIDEFGEVTI
jgi:hypothetical protein